jgi:glycosyltransferase involved in cell wall biosynthesis
MVAADPARRPGLHAARALPIMRPVPLSVCIITLNEEEDLPRCLASVAGLAQQIVVLDSGSSDRTQSLATEAGAEVSVREFRGHVEQKNAALALARHEWVLSLDADEWLDEALRAEVARVIDGGAPEAVQGYELDRRSLYLGAWIDHCGWAPQWRLRLVRRGPAKWTGMDPHDRLEVPGRVERLKGRLGHRPYRDLADHVAKVNRYTDLMATRRREAGVRPPALALLLRPPARFARMYLLRAGFLDGWRGLVVSAMGAYYVFLKYAKLREAWGRSAPSGEGPAGAPAQRP